MTTEILRYNKIPVLNITGKSTNKLEGDSGTTQHTFQISRSQQTNEPCSASWRISGDVDANDFFNGVTSGTVSFANGVTSNTVILEALGDDILEQDESFMFILHDPVNCIINKNVELGVIIDDDDETPQEYSNTATDLLSFMKSLGTLTNSTAVQNNGNISLTSNGVTVDSELYITDSPGTLDQSTADSWFGSANNSKASLIYVKGDLNIPDSVLFTPPSNKLFTSLYVDGNLTLNGNVVMTGKGANHGPTGSNVYGNTIPIALGFYSGVTNPYIPKQGGKGGDGRGSNGSGLSGDNGVDGSTGGGGSGRFIASSVRSGNGAYGSLFSGGPGGGGTRNSVVEAGNGASFGGPGGDGAGGSSVAGGGAGNPPGDSGISDLSISRGTGGLVFLFVANTLYGNGYILAEGKEGRSPTSSSGGGGSGGGSITVMSCNNQSLISAYANGGAGGSSSGGAGGDGSVRFLSIKNNLSLPGKNFYVSAEGSSTNLGTSPDSPALLEDFVDGGNKQRYLTQNDKINIMNEGKIFLKEGLAINKANLIFQAYQSDRPTIDGSYPEFHHGANGTYLTSKRINLSHSNWVKSNTTISSVSSFRDPDDDYKGFELKNNSNNTTHGLLRSANVNSDLKVMVLYAKKKLNSNINHVYLQTTSNGFISRTHFNIDSGSVATSIGQANGWIEEQANSWYKCVMRCSNVSTGTVQILYGMSENDAQTSYSGSEDGVYVYGPDFSDYVERWIPHPNLYHVNNDILLYRSTSTYSPDDAGSFEGGRFWANGIQSRLITHRIGLGALANTISDYKSNTGNYFIGYGIYHDGSRWNTRMQRPSANAMNNRDILELADSDPNKHTMEIYPDQHIGVHMQSENIKIKNLRIRNYHTSVATNDGAVVENANLHGGYVCSVVGGNNVLFKNTDFSQHQHTDKAFIAFNDIKGGTLAAKWHKLQGVELTSSGNNVLFNGCVWNEMFDAMLGGGTYNLTVNNFIMKDIWDDAMQDSGNKYVTYKDGKILGAGINRQDSGALPEEGGDYNRVIKVIFDNNITIFTNRSSTDNNGLGNPRAFGIHGSSSTYRPYQILNCTFVANGASKASGTLSIHRQGPNTNAIRWQECYNSIFVMGNGNTDAWIGRDFYPSSPLEFWDGMVIRNNSGGTLFRLFNNPSGGFYNSGSGITSVADFISENTPDDLTALTANQHPGFSWHSKSIDLDAQIDENYRPAAGYCSNVENLANTTRSGIFSDQPYYPYIGAVDPSPVLSIIALSADKNEGNTGTTDFTFRVSRSGSRTFTSRADWTITGNVNSGDFTHGLSNTVYVNSSNGFTDVVLTVNADAIIESDEPFTIALSNPANCTISSKNSSANGVIRNDDSSSGPSYSNTETDLKTFMEQALNYGITATPTNVGNIHLGVNLNVPADLMVINSPGSINQTTANSWFSSANNTRAALIYSNGDLTIPNGVELGPKHKQNKLFTCIYVDGDFVLNGNVIMTARGANHGPTGSDTYGNNIPIAIGTYSSVTDPHVPKQGGAGAFGRGSNGSGLTGDVGTNGGTGGGGSGRFISSAVASGNGAYGSLFSGGPGGGGTRGAAVAAGNGASFGGPGGDAATSTGTQASGGAGNPAGAIGTGQGLYNSDGTGGVIIIYVSGTFSGNGYILAEGVPNKVPGSSSGGGASGGGSITVMCGTDSSSVGIYANGGVATNSGGSGGDGTARVLIIP